MGVALIYEKHPHPRSRGTAAFQTNFRVTFLLFLSSPLLFFFFSSAQFLQKVNPPFERPFMFPPRLLCGTLCTRESMVIIFPLFTFLCFLAFWTEQRVGNIPRDRVSLRIFEGNKGWKIFSRKFEFSKRHADGIVSVRVIKSAENKQARQVVAGIIIA